MENENKQPFISKPKLNFLETLFCTAIFALPVCGVFGAIGYNGGQKNVNERIAVGQRNTQNIRAPESLLHNGIDVLKGKIPSSCKGPNDNRLGDGNNYSITPIYDKNSEIIGYNLTVIGSLALDSVIRPERFFFNEDE